MKEQISQIKFDKIFIKKLLDKLKVGDARSIHLNALPGRSATRLDLFELSKIDKKDNHTILKKNQLENPKNTPEKFIKRILNNDFFSFDISYDDVDLGELDEDEKKQLSLLSKKLNTLVIENNDNFLEFGIKNFGLGFPLLIKSDKADPTKIIKAPLFIWHLDIERSSQNKNKWTIKKEEDFPIKLNELLISHLVKDESIHLPKISEEILEDGILDENELSLLCENVLSKLNAIPESINIRIEKCLDKKRIESINHSKPWIQWSGVLGIYRSQKETIIQSNEELLERIGEFESENLVLEKFQTSTITAVETDPSQEKIINSLTKNEIKLIQGPPGTGKSQSITAIVANALASGAKCLIVCEKKTALDVIQTNLKNIGLGDFSIVIDDVNKDRKNVIQKARDINDNLNLSYDAFSRYDFENKYEKFCHLKKELNEKYPEPLKKILGDFSWKQLIGLYIRFSKSNHFQDVAKKLRYNFLQFDFEEYSQYLNTIEEASLLYQKLKEDSGIIFSKISSNLFQSEYKWRTQEEVKTTTDKLLNSLKSFSSFLSQKNQSDCEEKKVSLFKENSINDAKVIDNDLIENITYFQNLYKKIFEIAKNKKKEFLNILKLANDFLSEKQAKDFQEKKVSIFDDKALNIGLEYFRKVIDTLQSLLELFESGENIAGQKFYKKSWSNQFLETTFSVFSKKFKKICAVRKNIFNQIKKLNNEILFIQKLDFREFEIKDIKNLSSFYEVKESISKDFNLAKKKYKKIQKINEYRNFLIGKENEILKLETDKVFDFKLKRLLELKSYEKICQFYKDLLDKITSTEIKNIHLAGFFKQNNQDIQKFKKTLIHRLEPIESKTKELSSFNFENLTLKNFEEYQFLKDVDNSISELLKRVQNIHSRIFEIEKLQLKIQKHESGLEKIMSNGVFNFKIKKHFALANFEKLKTYYTNLSVDIEKINKHFDVYEDFHNWRFFESDRSKNEIAILSALKIASPKEWENIFKAWYYRGCLLNYEEISNIVFNKSDAKLLQLTSLYKDLKNQQLTQIKNIFGNKRRKELDRLDISFNLLYNLRKNKNFSRRNSLRRIIKKDLSLFTTLFPVILTNPSTVNAIFPLQQGLFEIVVFDEASQLRIADTFTSLIRGQYKIIVGDEHQMPPSNYFQSNSESFDSEKDEDEENDFSEAEGMEALAESDSLLQYAEDMQDRDKSSLDFHYRSEHPELIEFSNHAFYGGNLVPFPKQNDNKPIEFRAVNGIYEYRTNPSEIEEIIKILYEEIHPEGKWEYPSVGIATFNINQRNLIIESLNKAAESNSSFGQKLQVLKEKGLFVKNLENIQGDERDIMIISTTYGIKPDGKFSQNFARLNRIEGYKLLNVLITRAKKKLYICTSIPKGKYLGYKEMIENEGNNKKGILYAYLAYAEAISGGDNETAKSLLNILKNKSYETPRVISQNDGLSESPFEEEVYEELLEYIEKNRIIQQYKVGGFRLDFLIKTDDKNIVLECDGKSYHQTDEAYAHDMYRQKILEKMGFIVYRIWSTNWFQNKEIEIKKFLQFIKKEEKNN